MAPGLTKRDHIEEAYRSIAAAGDAVDLADAGRHVLDAVERAVRVAQEHQSPEAIRIMLRVVDFLAASWVPRALAEAERSCDATRRHMLYREVRWATASAIDAHVMALPHGLSDEATLAAVERHCRALLDSLPSELGPYPN